MLINLLWPGDNISHQAITQINADLLSVGPIQIAMKVESKYKQYNNVYKQ